MVGAIAVITDLLLNGVPFRSDGDRKGRSSIARVHTFVAALQMKNKLYRARITVRETNMGMIYYGHEMENIDKKMPEDCGEGIDSDTNLPDSHPSGTIRLGRIL